MYPKDTEDGRAVAEHVWSARGSHRSRVDAMALPINVYAPNWRTRYTAAHGYGPPREISC